MKYIVIDASKGGKDLGVTGNNIIEKEYTYLISKYIYDRLKDEGIKVFLTRDGDYDLTIDERIKMIKDQFGSSNDVLVITNELSNVGSGIDIIYALRDEDFLAEEIINFLSLDNFNINDYYQLRDENNPNLDSEKIIRDTSSNETIIIRYGNVNNSNDSVQIKNRWREMAEAVVKGIISYVGGSINDSSYYTVVSGDSLYSIAKRYNTTVNELKRVNNLNSNNLSIGQVLKVPSKENDSNNIGSNYINYIVVSGDSLYSISKRYGTTVDELKRINNLTGNNLNIGQVLNVPSKENDSNNIGSNYINYIVVSGDSLYSISKRYGTTVDELKRINNLNNNNLNIGQVLIIPGNQNNYIVVKGDSLYSIAKRYNTTVDELKKINNLNNNNLSIGQVLRIK